MGESLRYSGAKWQTALKFALFFLCFLSFPLAQAFATSQADAQKKAADINYQGSNDSMEAATTSGMMAMMNLAALNIGGAISNGYRAYGQYINSEKLDDLEFRTHMRKNRMGSVGAPGGSSSSLSERQPTTFSRLNPDFLHKGKAAAVAEEFEKRSGMSRERFLSHLSSATDSGLSYDDPSLMKKLEARYQLFKQDVKNPDFRQGLDRVENMVPQSAREEMLGKLQSMYFDSWMDVQDPSPATFSLAASTTQAAPNTSSGASAGPEQAEPNRNLASSPSFSADESNGLFIGLATGDSRETLSEFLNSPDSKDDDSLFVKVSKRYRILAPQLLGRTSMIPSR